MRFKWLFVITLCSSLHASSGFAPPWGKDADLRVPQQETKKAPPHSSPMIYLATKAIRFHQEVLSPVDGPRSHFRPSSSQYMLEALHKHGFIEGFLMGCDRLLRENSDEWVYQKRADEKTLFKYDPVP